MCIKAALEKRLIEHQRRIQHATGFQKKNLIQSGSLDRARLSLIEFFFLFFSFFFAVQRIETGSGL